MQIDKENFISLNEEAPPFDIFVKVKGCDFMGNFYSDILFARKQYKQLSKNKQRGWRWVDKEGNKCKFNNDIDGWKYDR